MSNLSLYELAGEYQEAAAKMADLDLPMEVISDTLEGMQGAIQAKAESVACFIRNLEASAAAIKTAEEQMAIRRKAIEARAGHIRQYLLTNLQATGIRKIDCPLFAITLRDNPAAVVIDSESQIPERFMRQPDPPQPSPDKKAIAAALKAGEDLPWAHLSNSQRVEIR